MYSRLPTCHFELSRIQLRPGMERIIRAMSFGDHRYIEILAEVDGRPKGGTQARPENAPILLEALEQARHSTADREIGSFVDGRMKIQIRTGRYKQGGAAIFWQKFDSDGHEAGTPIIFRGSELDSLEQAADWLVS